MYRGRFAPSPTGPLHFGSLVAALGSYLEARVHEGEWLVRIEDLDPPRTVPGTAEHILRTLEAFGFEWQGTVMYQSQRQAAYQAALDDLCNRQLAYPCTCSRSELQAMQSSSVDGEELHYPGLCRTGVRHPERERAWRLRVDDAPVQVHDAVQGDHLFHVSHDSGDFIIKRRDGLFAYQLAVVVDDAAQGITQVVRGCDLLTSTPRQLLLQRALGLPQPQYAHLPVITGRDGKKLGKSTAAPAIDPAHASAILYRALQHLQQAPPAALRFAPLSELWQWAISHWNMAACQRLQNVPLDA